MSAILLHDNQFGNNSKKVPCVDKEIWLQNVMWPMADFTKWLARVLYYNNKHFKTWKLHRIFEACNIFTLRQNVTNADWHDIDTPIDLAIQWLGICSFERPRYATSCITKYNDAGRVVVDRNIGVAALQGHTIAEASSFWRLLGWTKVDRSAFFLWVPWN